MGTRQRGRLRSPPVPRPCPAPPVRAQRLASAPRDPRHPQTPGTPRPLLRTPSARLARPVSPTPLSRSSLCSPLASSAALLGPLSAALRHPRSEPLGSSRAPAARSPLMPGPWAPCLLRGSLARGAKCPPSLPLLSFCAPRTGLAGVYRALPTWGSSAFHDINWLSCWGGTAETQLQPPTQGHGTPYLFIVQPSLRRAPSCGLRWPVTFVRSRSLQVESGSASCSGSRTCWERREQPRPRDVRAGEASCCPVGGWPRHLLEALWCPAWEFGLRPISQ